MELKKKELERAIKEARNNLTLASVTVKKTESIYGSPQRNLYEKRDETFENEFSRSRTMHNYSDIIQV